MKLTLLETNAIKMQGIGNKELKSNIGENAFRHSTQKLIRNGDLNADDRQTSELLSEELFTDDVSPLDIYLTILEDIRGPRMSVSLIRYDYDHGQQSILQKLWNRFHDQVTISVVIKFEYTGGEILPGLASFEGMTIVNSQGIWSCGGISPTNITSFDLDAKVYIKLTAEIEDRLINERPPLQEDDEILFGQKALQDGYFGDVTIIAPNGDQARAHKCFLAACSPLLYAMMLFQTDMGHLETAWLDMTDVTSETVWAFFRYVYYRDLKIPKENIKVASELLYVAHKNEVSSLETAMAMIACLLEWKTEAFSVELAFATYLIFKNIETAVQLKRKTLKILKPNIERLEVMTDYRNVFYHSSQVAMELVRDLVLGEI